MSEVKYGVLFQFSLGLPWRQASQEERDKATEGWQAMLAKWEADGIERLGYIVTQATEYAHTGLFRLKNADQHHQMEQDINDAVDAFKLVEKFSLAIGRMH